MSGRVCFDLQPWTRLRNQPTIQLHTKDFIAAKSNCYISLPLRSNFHCRNQSIDHTRTQTTMASFSRSLNIDWDCDSIDLFVCLFVCSFVHSFVCLCSFACQTEKRSSISRPNVWSPASLTRCRLISVRHWSIGLFDTV